MRKSFRIVASERPCAQAFEGAVSSEADASFSAGSVGMPKVRGGPAAEHCGRHERNQHVPACGFCQRQAAAAYELPDDAGYGASQIRQVRPPGMGIGSSTERNR